jgi:hypothetical protein
MVNIPGADHVAHGQAAALLAINVCTWPNHLEEPIPCKSMHGRNKLMAEAGLTETKMILGWKFDFWHLLISLPKNKFIARMMGISQLLVEGSTTAKELESTIGRLGHLVLVMPGVHHFLGLLCELQQLAPHRRLLHITKTCPNDLLLMLYFLDIAKKGIDVNLVMIRQPAQVY